MVTAVKGSVAIVVIAAALPLVVAVLLMAGGAAERDVAECSLEARKLFPVLPEPPNKWAREDYVYECMEAKGWHWVGFENEGCDLSYSYGDINPDCFEPYWQQKTKAWWRALVSLLPSAR